MEWATTITAAGAFLGGLALPIAFLQLGAQRQDRLRAQVGKIGASAGPKCGGRKATVREGTSSVPPRLRRGCGTSPALTIRTWQTFVPSPPIWMSDGA